MLNNTKVMVTGGAGFIGSELVRQLAESGSHVTAVDNLVNGKRENLADCNTSQLEVADIRDLARMSRLLDGVAVVFHLACLGVRHSIHSPRENHDVSATATLDLLELARRRGVARFVYVSSSEVYGTARWAPMAEDHPTYPMTIYGAGKLAGECYARAYWETYRYPTVILRPFNAFGPRSHHEGDSGEVIPKFMLRAMASLPLVIFGDGSQTRDFTYVADTARGIMAAGASERTIGQTFNLGSGREISINELAKAVSQIACGGEAVITHDNARPGDVLRLCADSLLAREVFSFQPRHSLEDGLASLLASYKSSGLPIAELLADERIHNWESPDHAPRVSQDNSNRKA